MSITGPIPRRRCSLYDAVVNHHHLLPAPLTARHYDAIQLLTSITLQQGSDELLWILSASGLFSVKSLYRLMSTGGKILSATSSLWKIRVTPSMRVFFYLLLNGRLLTHDVMERRKLNYLPGCVMCAPDQPETAMHLFFLCPYAQLIWSTLSLASGFQFVKNADSVSLTYLASVPNMRNRHHLWRITFINALWFLWRERNERTFHAKKSPPLVLIRAIQEETRMCTKYC